MSGIRIAFVSTSVPRRCGIATFTADLMGAVRIADPTAICRVAAIDEPAVLRQYASEVRWRIRQGDAESYRAAARAINGSNADVVNVQHEFGLYGRGSEPVYANGRWSDSLYEDHSLLFLKELRKPVVTTMHTVLPRPSPPLLSKRELRKPVVTTMHAVLPRPSPSIRATVRGISDLSDEIVVMASTAVGLLANDYGLARPPRVIPHGMPVIDPHGRHSFKRKLGVEGRTIISTFGLVDPRKGLQYMIQAMPAVVARYPDALYLIAGQTHPDLLRIHGEAYRNSLVAESRALGMEHHVAFI